MLKKQGEWPNTSLEILCLRCSLLYYCSPALMATTIIQSIGITRAMTWNNFKALGIQVAISLS